MAGCRHLCFDAVGIGLPMKAKWMVTAAMNDACSPQQTRRRKRGGAEDTATLSIPRRGHKGSLTRCLGQTRIPFPKPRWVCLVNVLIFCPDPVWIRAEICRVIGTIVPDTFNEEMAVCSQFECLRASKMRGVLENII